MRAYLVRAYLFVQIYTSYMLAILPVLFLRKLLKFNLWMWIVFIVVPLSVMIVANTFFLTFMLFFRFQRSVCAQEVLYLATNPGKIKRRIASSQSEIIFRPFEVYTDVRDEIITTVRNALWINVTGLSTLSNFLPLPIRTRATTIMKAVFIRYKLERRLGYRKELVHISIAKDHRLVEENIEADLNRRHRLQKDKYWKYWNNLSYEPRHFDEVNGSRVAVGRLRTARPGEYTNSLGENKEFHIDTGDLVKMTEVTGSQSSISFRSSSGIKVKLPLTCAEANNLVHWIWQHSIDTVYGALEGREAPSVDRNTWEIDIGLFILGFVLRIFFYYYFGIVDDRTKPGASDPVSIALLHLSIIAVVYTIRQSYVKDWAKYRGKLVESELCYLTLSRSETSSLGRLMRTILDTEEDKNRVAPVFIGDTDKDLFLHESWGIDCYNPEQWEEERGSANSVEESSTRIEMHEVEQGSANAVEESSTRIEMHEIDD